MGLIKLETVLECLRFHISSGHVEASRQFATGLAHVYRVNKRVDDAVIVAQQTLADARAAITKKGNDDVC